MAEFETMPAGVYLPEDVDLIQSVYDRICSDPLLQVPAAAVAASVFACYRTGLRCRAHLEAAARDRLSREPAGTFPG